MGASKFWNFFHFFKARKVLENKQDLESTEISVRQTPSYSLNVLHAMLASDNTF